MTSCIDTACPVDSKFDVDAVYFSLSRCGLDEDSFNALFQYVVLATDGTDPVRAYAIYCKDVVHENRLREHLNRVQLSMVTLTTMFDLLEEYEAAVHVARFADRLIFDALAIAEALGWVANCNEPARGGLEAEADFVGFSSERLVSIMIGGAA